MAGLAAPVYLATDFRVFPIPKDAKPSLMSHPIEKTLLSLLKGHLFSAPLYFSYGWDLPSSFQRQSRSDYDTEAPLWQKTDERFFWNRFVQSALIDTTQTPGGPDLSRFILPIVFGFFETKLVTINGRSFLFGLISRRSRYRAGTRYFSRGLDNDGHVSNFNESEQFVLTDKTDTQNGKGKALSGNVRMSYVQTRGSVPVFWAEINNLRYKPDLLIMDREETAQAMGLHFEEQVGLYGDNYLVNLVNQSGYEKPVKDAYEASVDQLGNPHVHYTYYDFHHECKGMKFQNVIHLVETLSQKGHTNDDWYFYDASADKPLRTQKSVVRTNCMDCLDRTNVVQGTLAKCVVEKQLQEVGILGKGETMEKHPEFWHIFRNVWADHADVISKAYSGTGALKTDFTRTGKRSKEGALQDGVNSLTRYVKNNFFDGSRQDAYDLFTGAWTPRKGVRGDKRALAIRALPYLWLASLMAFVLVLLVPSLTDKVRLHRTAVVVTASAVAAASFYMMTERGMQYVAWPTLNYPQHVLEYTGPGYTSGKHGRVGLGKYARNEAGPQRTSRSESEKRAAAAATGVRGRRGAAYDDDE